jgi:hypothetical protein
MNPSERAPDKIRYRLEQETLSRRRLITDICAATGWVFVGQASLAWCAEPTVTRDAANDDPAWGTVKGRIVFDGEAPEVKEVELDKAGLSPADLQWFRSMGPVLNQEWVVNPSDKSVRWVFVWLLPENPRDKIVVNESLLDLPEEKKLVVVDQEPLGYVPHAVGVGPGQGLMMRNQGPVAHVFNFTGFKNPSFNRAMPPGSEVKVDEIKPESAAIQVSCPPHPWERLWLRSFEHPYFAVTDENGQFEIPLAPAGKNRLVVWHESAGFAGGRNGRNGSIIEIEGGRSPTSATSSCRREPEIRVRRNDGDRGRAASRPSTSVSTTASPVSSSHGLGAFGPARPSAMGRNEARRRQHQKAERRRVTNDSGLEDHRRGQDDRSLCRDEPAVVTRHAAFQPEHRRRLGQPSRREREVDPDAPSGSDTGHLKRLFRRRGDRGRMTPAVRHAVGGNDVRDHQQRADRPDPPIQPLAEPIRSRVAVRFERRNRSRDRSDEPERHRDTDRRANEQLFDHQTPRELPRQFVPSLTPPSRRHRRLAPDREPFATLAARSSEGTRCRRQ